MASEARLGREALVVPVSTGTPETRLGREAVIVAHTRPGSDLHTRLGRICVIVAISNPHGWDIFKDPGNP